MLFDRFKRWDGKSKQCNNPEAMKKDEIHWSRKLLVEAHRELGATSMSVLDADKPLYRL